MPLPSSDYPNPLFNGLYTANTDTTYIPPVSIPPISIPQQSWDFGADYFLPQNGATASPMLTGPFAQMAQNLLNGFDFSSMRSGNRVGGFNFGNFGNFSNSFVFNPSTSSSSSDSLSDKSEEERVRAFLNKAVELSKSKDKNLKVKISESVLNEIKEALKTTGSDEEKLDAMTDALESIPEDKRNQIVEAMNLDTLTEMGYQRFANDKTIKGKLTSIHDKLTVMTTKDNCDTDVVTELITAVSGNSDKLLAAISAWNNDHNTSGCILGDIVSKINSSSLEDADKKSILDKQIKPLVQAMLDCASTKISDLEDDGYSVSDLKSKRKTLLNANDALTATAFDKQKLDALVKAYKEMYVALRVNLAKQADDNIQEDYGFLNNDDKTLIKSTLITDATNTDLRSEGLSSIEVTAGEKEAEATDFSEMETDEALETLVENESLEAKTVGNKTYYVTKFGSNDSKRYYYKDGDVIKEIKNVKSIDENSGTITFRGGAPSQALVTYITAQKDEDDNEVSPETIEETNKSLKVIQGLYNEKRLSFVLTNGVPDAIFKNANSKMLSPDKKNHYYTVKDGKLCEIKYKDRLEAPLTFSDGKFKIWKGDKWCSTGFEKDGVYPDDFTFVEVSKDSVQATLPLESEISVPTTEQGFIALGLTPVRMYKKSDIGDKMPCMVDYDKGSDYYVLNGNYYSALGSVVTNMTEELYIPDENASPENRPPEKDSAWYSKIGEIHKSLRFSYYRVNADFAKKVLIYEQVTGVKLDFTPPSWYEPQNCFADMIMKTFLDEYNKLEQPGFDIKSYKCPFVNGIVYPED